jgi:peptidoglycan/LPS O-acetylase OafA/YrhL
MVLLHHGVVGWTIGNGDLSFIPKPLYFVVARGWLGVDLFFVLSGVLITGILLDSKRKPRFFRNFYGRRVLRIMPLYFAVIAITFLAYRQPAEYFLLSAAFMANFAGLFHVGVPHGPSVFWSLAVEEHFYLVWPMIVRFVRWRPLAVICVTIFAMSPILRGVAVTHGMDPDQIYPLSMFRFDGLALGALLAIWLRSDRCSPRTSLRVAGLLFALSILIVVAGAPFGILGTKTVASASLRYTHMQLLFASGILASLALAGTVWTRWLTTPFMRISSDLSYCLYLIHLSIGDGYYWLLKQWNVDPAAAFGIKGALACQIIAVIGTSFILAALSKKYLEDPCLRLKRYFYS